MPSPYQATGITARPRRRSVPAALAALLCTFAILAVSAPAGAATRGAPVSAPSTLDLPAPAGRFPDRLIRGRHLLRRLHRTARSAESYAVLGGQQLEISSAYYGVAEMQDVVNVLGGLIHGAEMSTLSVYLATPDEIGYICGEGALACYGPGLGLMVVSGDHRPSYGVPRDYTIAHEYGHHVANDQLNSPWSALDTGGKRWATYEHVCQGVRKGQLFPGDEDYHYWENPGEGFAESNAHLNYPGVSVPWGYSPLLRPTQGSLAALKADITSPWTGPVTVNWDGSLWPKRHNPALRRFSIPLDGEVSVRLNGPEGSNYDLIVLGRKPRARYQRKGQRHNGQRRRARTRAHRVLARGVSPGPSEQLDFSLCGQGVIRVEVRRRSGAGPFKVSVSRP